jgi:sulfhydrogenase subunit beta (sulfur reductase)
MSAEVRWLTREAVEALLARLARAGELIAPVAVEGDVLFLPVGDPAEICRDYINSHLPPKEHLLPTPEMLVAYRVSGGVPELESESERPAPSPRVIFGIRSCDVAGTAYLEGYFSGALFGRPDTADAQFAGRREATTLISVVCQRVGPTCMCVCCAGGPALTQGYDWQLTELADGWLVEIGSPRGARLAERVADLLSPAPAAAAAEKEARVRATVESFQATATHRVPTMAATRMVSAGRLDENFWRAVGDRCLECGGCAFVCPTCWCFNVVDIGEPGSAGFEEAPGGLRPMVPGGACDKVVDGRWERVRLRDNCMLAGFIRQAGGGYPRWTCGERCLTRFFHKLSQQFQERTDALGCTGCGRCISACLGEEGIDRIAEGMRDALTGVGRASAPDARARAAAKAAAAVAAAPPAVAAAGRPPEVKP